MKKFGLILLMAVALVGGTLQLTAGITPQCRSFCLSEQSTCLQNGGSGSECKDVYIDCILHYCVNL